MRKIKEKIFLLAASAVRAIRGEVSTQQLVKRGLIVGRNFSRQGGVRIDSSYSFLIEIGDNVGLSTNVTILAHDNSTKRIMGVCKLGRVTIGNNVFVGSGSVILPNVKIGDNVIIGAGSLVNKDIPGNSVYAGNPARFIRSISDYKEMNIQQMQQTIIIDRSFNMLSLTNNQKQHIKEQLADRLGYFLCENYRVFYDEKGQLKDGK